MGAGLSCRGGAIGGGGESCSTISLVGEDGVINCKSGKNMFVCEMP